MGTRERATARWMEMRRELNASGLSRREVAKMGLLAAGGVLLGADGRPARAQFMDRRLLGRQPRRADAALGGSPSTTPFVEPLLQRQPSAPETLSPAPNPAAHQYYRRFPAKKTYLFDVKTLQHRFHPQLAASDMWGYDGKHPGPLVDARYGEPIVIRVVNNLPAASEHKGYGIPQIITHLHNFHSAPESDGGPWGWYGRGGSKDHHYTMARAGFSNPAAVPAQYRDASGGDVRETLTSLFFHDHRPDYTAANVYRGLIGLFRLYDERDTGNETDASAQAWRLPSGPYDVPLLIADRRFDPQTGELFFDQFDLDGHLGDKYTVNGRVQPYFEVKRRKYRFRVYTPGPTRIYHLVFRHNGANQPFTQLSNSGNLLEAPRQNLTRIEMVPANRVDLIVDFRRFPAGAKVHLANILPMTDGREPERGERLNPDQAGNQIMEFRVTDDAADPSQVPAAFRPFPPTNLPVARRRNWKFDRSNGQWTVNGQLFDVEAEIARVANPANQVKRGSNEIWTLETGGGWEHPIHLHLEEAQELKINGVTTQQAQRFRSDVHHLSENAREIEILMSFRDFPDPDFTGATTLGERGRYVMHCHNTVHEDHAMMASWTVVP